jgi:predicted nucleic acid-binding protein
MGDLDEASYAGVLARIGPVVTRAEEVQPSEEVRQTALRLVRVHDLRAADSLQLAAALVWARHVATGLEFVCLDTKLGAAAEKEGFSVAG